MADNVTANTTDSGGPTFASDDIGGVQFPRVKLIHGADGVNAGDVSSANPLPVDTEMPAAAALADAASNPTTPTVGAAGLLYNGTTWARIRGDITNGLDVDVTRIIPGTGATNLGKAEDAAHTSGDVGVMALGVRQDAPTALGANGDYVPVMMDGIGRLWTAGQIAHDSAVSGAPVRIGGKSSAAAPADVSADGDQTDIWVLRNGAQATVLTAAGALIGGDAANGLDVDITRLPKPATPSQSSVAGSATSVQLLASNSSRLGATITNDSTAILYLKLGTTASTTSFTVQIPGTDANGLMSYYEVPFGYTGRIDGIWASAAGNARITELI